MVSTWNPSGTNMVEVMSFSSPAGFALRFQSRGLEVRRPAGLEEGFGGDLWKRKSS